ncbi:uncharacterized protein UTRI_03193 [Ustilago trichophora]|uniref:Ubiquitin-like domain-containing protein n=1 Tax=Ustilago trichophora TaxID=86804 RepID=A0A5C3E5V4_9BASI|nr:uncharacterized protein UTRI_03193 [Ustilago trichophora]
MYIHHHENDVRLDLGEGPSTLNASIRVRPITIRFTEPGVRDLQLNLHSLTSLRPVSTTQSNPTTSTPSAVPPRQLIFDFDSEQRDPQPLTPPIRTPQDTQPDSNLVQSIISTLAEQHLMGDETVHMLKKHMSQRRDGVRGRRLRLIHAGRILRDGVRVVGYLEELDLRTRLQSRQTLRHLALDGSDRTNPDSRDHIVGEEEREEEDAVEGSEEEEEEEEEEKEEGERDTVEKRQMSVRELFDWLAAQMDSGEDAGEDASGSISDSRLRGAKGKGKTREPAFYDDLVRVTIRTAPTVYVQCSVGEPESQSSPSSPSATFSSAPLVDVHDPPEPGDSIDPELDRLENDQNRGFNRLLSAGLSPSEISSIRNTFRTTHPLDTPYDLISAREHAQHLLEMEESWMDSFHTTNNGGAVGELGEFGEPGGRPGAYVTVMQGLMVGFFMPPLIPLFWFRDRAHPSSLPTGAVGGGGGEDGEEGDDEEDWERERASLTRESVFGSTMQVSILFGVVAK